MIEYDKILIIVDRKKTDVYFMNRKIFSKCYICGNEWLLYHLSGYKASEYSIYVE